MDTEKYDKLIFQKYIKLLNLYKCMINNALDINNVNIVNNETEIYDIIENSFNKLESKFINVIYNKYVKIDNIENVENDINNENKNV
jgi:hypothetical protein